MTDATVTIWHNPKCGTSRNVLEMIRQSGVEPTVVEYVKAGWDRATLERLAAETGAGARGLMRVKGTPAEALGLTAPGVADAAILDAMVADPILVERPIVQTPKGARLCRPSERVFDLLDNPPAEFTKEDGEVVQGR
jgi:arsenate reductase